MGSINMLCGRVMVDLKLTFLGFRILYVCCSSAVKLQFTNSCNTISLLTLADVFLRNRNMIYDKIYEGWNFNSGNYLFTTDTK